ncbi:YfhH family protein [Pseudogracilibacillus sp. ICA-222130]|uniref:YfhH family protein n=1 Tax=Pseudogracilibacillus sp. ICA-222130 TaxID=3134655 RepID=UPI0030BEC4A8
MSIRYSDYTVEQLRTELGQLVEERQKAEQLGEVNKVAILERKIQIVTSYTLDPDSFHAGDTHQLVGDPGYKFKINFINGIMAWGHRINLLGEIHELEEALPISLLGDVVKQ